MLPRVAGAMELSGEWRDALARGGVHSVEDLARASDLAALASATGVPVERLEGLREVARRQVIDKLREAGITTEAQLVEVDAAQLASRVGMAKADVEWFQAAARETLSGLPARRVVLRPGGALARVRLEDEVHEGVPLRTLAPDARPADVAEGAGNLVLLRVGEPTALARVAGRVHESLPVFAEAEGGEVPVRVAAVRVVDASSPAPARGGSLFGFRK